MDNGCGRPEKPRGKRILAASKQCTNHMAAQMLPHHTTAGSRMITQHDKRHHHRDMSVSTSFHTSALIGFMFDSSLRPPMVMSSEWWGEVMSCPTTRQCAQSYRDIFLPLYKACPPLSRAHLLTKKTKRREKKIAAVRESYVIITSP